MPISVRSSSMTFLAFSMPASMFGVLWKDIRIDFGQSLGTLGTVTLVYGAARMSTSGLGRRATRRLGIGVCFTAALVCLIISDLAISVSNSWLSFLAAVAVLGVVSGFLDSVGAGVIATLGDVGSAGTIHGFYGVGATIGPLVVAVVSDWRWSLVITAVVALMALGLAVYARRSWPAPPRACATVHVGPPPRRATVLSLTMFFAFVALEVTFGNWLYIYLTEGRSLGDTIAVVGVSAFWGGATVGRLLLVSERVRVVADRVGMPVLALAGIGATLCATVAPGVAVIVATAAVGLTLSAIVPTLTARTADRVGPAHAQQVSGWQLLAANSGAIGVPFLTGKLVDVHGAGVTIVVVLAVFAVGLPTLWLARPTSTFLAR